MIRVDQENHPFTLEHYRKIVQTGLEQNYRYKLFTENDLGDRRIYFRHDVDNSVNSAFTIAGIEAELGVKSTYLFLLRSENYNLLSGTSYVKIREIAAMGHEIGLHFSLEAHKKDERENHDISALPELVIRDVNILSEILNMDIRVWSLHNPGVKGKEMLQVDVPGVINTYHPRFFEDVKYISESNMAWREKCPCEMFKDNLYSSYQVLVHPMSYCDKLKTDADILLYFLYEKVLELKKNNEIQNRTLEKKGLTMADITKYFTERANR